MTSITTPSMAAAVLLPLLLAGCGKSAESTVETFYRAVGKGEIAEAQTHLSKEIVGVMGPQKLGAALSEETRRVQNCGGIKDVKVQLGDGAEVRFGSVVVTYAGNCAQRRENLKLVKEDGRWKLAPQK